MALNRVVLGSYFGDLLYPSTSFNVLLDDLWKACLKRGGISGLRRYGDPGDRASAVGLTYGVVFPPAWNLKNNYGSPTTLEEIPSYFDGYENSQNTRRGLLHTDANPNPPTPFSYPAQHTIAANQPNSFRISPAKAPDEIDGGDPVVSLIRRTWGGWRLEIRNRQAVVQKFKNTYTQADDDELDELLLENDRTALEDARVGELKASLFEVEQSISLGSSEAGGFYQPTTLTFIAEPRGIVHVINEEGGDVTTIEIPSLLKKRMVSSSDSASVPNIVWYSSSPKITSHAGVFSWQEGRPDFAKQGKIRTGEWAPGFDAGVVPVKGQWDTSLPGTDVTFINESLGDDAQPPLYVVVGGTPQRNEFVATLTSGGTYTPFLYAAEASTTAGSRVGTDENVWDSDDHMTNGTTAIMDVQERFEGENVRLGWTIVLRCVNREDNTNELGDFPEAQERMIDVWVKGTRLIRKGKIGTFVKNNWASVGSVTDVTKAAPGATITMEVSDPWTFLDDDSMEDDPIGDGRTLGAYIRTILRNGGFTPTEITGVSASTGRVLPSAALGEAFAVRPIADVKRGDYLRDLIKNYGMGLRLRWDNLAGWWVLDMPSNVVQAAFSSSPSEPITGYRIEKGLTEIHDYSETYNVIQVQGAPDPETGVPITETWTIWEGFRAPNNYAYKGRRHRMDTVRDDALRTPDDVAWVLRSLVEKYGRPGRWVQFPTWFKPNLFPGDPITADGIIARIERIESASLAGRAYFNNGTLEAIGQMTIVARKLQKGEKP